MKIRTTIVFSCLTVLLVLGSGHRSGAQQNAPGPWDQIGIVSVMKVMQLSEKYVAHYKEVAAEQNQFGAELQKMAEELKTDQATLQTMRVGSEDHLAHYKSMLLKQATLEATEKYYNQSADAKNREWREKIYQEILSVTNAVAREKGLKMVFERSEPEFPLPNDSFLLTVSSHKVLYFDGPVDLTDQVIDKIDATQN